MNKNPIRQRAYKAIVRVTRPAYLLALPMQLVDSILMKGSVYTSYVLFYPYWVWRKKSIRNGIIWAIIVSLLIIEYLGVVALIGLLGWAGQFALAAGYMVFQFLILFTFLSSTKTIKLKPGDKGVKSFAVDFFGQEHVKEVVLGTIAMMSRENQEIMEALGATPPAGMVLTGPPGTGKTLIAQCAANEIEIPFIGMNGADFSAMFIGVGEMKVKGIDRLARKWANQYGGCVVFIDEMDAIMASRGNVEGDKNRGAQGMGGGVFGGGMGIRSMLLTAMDGTKEPQIRTDLVNHFFRFFGFEELQDGVVFWLGATNRLGAVDPAFLRPGRMDIMVQMDPPDKGSRRQIIQGYVDRITADDDVDVERLTDDLQGVTPADISGAFERVAARFTIKDGRKAINQADLEAALMEQMFGITNPIAEFGEGQREQVATHEAGHALVTNILMPKRRITNLSITRRGKGMLGFMRKVSPEEIYAMPLADVCAQIQVSWGGDIACEMIMGERWTGGRGDFDTVDQLMKTLAGHGYFNDQLPSDPLQPFDDEGIRQAKDRYSRRMKTSTRDMVVEHRAVIEDLRDSLLEHGELNSAQIYEILWAHGLGAYGS